MDFIIPIINSILTPILSFLQPITEAFGLTDVLLDIFALILNAFGLEPFPAPGPLM
ncbi:MAG: hypothetical protein LBL92_07345 [Propionibacteriaceae bacterium]|jgi:hypothetical protein|nr:hypothetical protein [Propionibacteriaceae bacterium]